MSIRLPDVDRLVVPGKRRAEISEVVSEIYVDYSTEQVAELTIVIVDQDYKLTKTPLAEVGTLVTFNNERWQVGTIEADLHGWGSALTIRCRDPLAKELRRTYKTSAEKKVQPSAWVSRRVRKAGGTALVQPAASRGTIAQSKTQSVLDVIDALGSDLDWSWTSHSDQFFFASRYYAWKGRLGQPTWPVQWATDPARDAVVARWVETDDDSNNNGELDFDVPYEMGRYMRPWHLVRSSIPGAEGTWLIENVQIRHDGVTPVRVFATQPQRPSPKPGSSSLES